MYRLTIFPYANLIFFFFLLYVWQLFTWHFHMNMIYHSIIIYIFRMQLPSFIVWVLWISEIRNDLWYINSEHAVSTRVNFFFFKKKKIFDYFSGLLLTLGLFFLYFQVASSICYKDSNWQLLVVFYCMHRSNWYIGI